MKNLEYLKYFEPARLRAAYMAIAGVLLTFGVSIPADWDSKAIAIISAVGVVYAFLTGELIRRSVNSPATADGVLKSDVKDGVIPAPGTTYDPDYDHTSDPATTSGAPSGSGPETEPPLPVDGAQDTAPLDGEM